MRSQRAGFMKSLAIGVALAMLPSCAQAQTKDTRMDPILHAPDFPKEFAWLNTDQPLSFKTNLKGQVVVIDFWTYCCINCMHVLPDLAFLEQKYKDQPVVVLGVHSSKFDTAV
jgi:thiol-disulfide isomerase/thioredoxin